MTFYVIGNGFDLHYGLKTRYDHFKSYLINNGYSDLIDRVDDLFYRIGGFDIDEITDWSKFEDMLVVFNNLDPDEIYDEAIDVEDAPYTYIETDVKIEMEEEIIED